MHTYAHTYVHYQIMYISSASTTNHFDLLINEPQLLSKYEDNAQTFALYIFTYVHRYVYTNIILNTLIHKRNQFVSLKVIICALTLLLSLSMLTLAHLSHSTSKQTHLVSGSIQYGLA